MAQASRRKRSGPSPLPRGRSRLFLISFFLVTIVLAYVSARTILNNAADTELREKIDALQERKQRNSLFAPADTTARGPVESADSSGAH